MIYKLDTDGDKLTGLDPVPFYDFGQLSKLEKDLENLLAENLLNKLFEDNALMPIYQEKPYRQFGGHLRIDRERRLSCF